MTMVQKLMERCLAALLTCTLVASSHAAIQVYSENTTPGDFFTNAGGTNTGHDFDGSGSAWLYNNVRAKGFVGINTTYARSGNGSAYFSTPAVASPGTTNGKADIEFYSDPVANVAGNFGPHASVASILGSLSDLTSLGYEWYRDASSTNSAVQHPSLRLLVSNGVKTGYLVYEGAYNGLLAAATNTWVSDVVGSSSNLWSTGSLDAFVPGSGLYTSTLLEWQNYLTGYSVIGVSAGVGSGWGQFVGAVDNITFGFGTGSGTTYNFEVRPDGVVPEAATVVVWSFLGVCASIFAWRTRRTNG